MEIKTIPKEFISIIPKYEGEENLLNLFLSKCDYVLNCSRIPGNPAQNLYLFHAISSRLSGKAATLLSDHPNINTYEGLKEILGQHFGDPRSEECIAIELESLKIKQSETYIQFCHRIQNMRSSLFAKVNRLADEGIKAAKQIVYNNTALNVFLYNLPEDMIRIVRLKGCSTLESALSIVTEEVNFKFQYDSKNKSNKQSQPQPHTTGLQPSLVAPKPVIQLPQGFKPPFNPVLHNNFRSMPQNNFKFGIPQNSGFRPNLSQQPPRFAPPMQGFRFGIPQNAPQRNFGQAPVYRPPFQQGGFKFGMPPQQNFKFGIPHQQQPMPKLQDSDVTMRTAPVRQNMTVNELFYENPSVDYEYTPDSECYTYEQDTDYTTNECNQLENTDEVYPENFHAEAQLENFQELASTSIVK